VRKEESWEVYYRKKEIVEGDFSIIAWEGRPGTILLRMKNASLDH